MSVSKLQVYRCNVCGIVVEALDVGAGELICCGVAMQLQPERTDGPAREKHVPWIDRVDTGVKVTVGRSGRHAMDPTHYVQWIELLAGAKAYRQFLEPGDAPEAAFPVQADDVTARSYCNRHGLWKA